MEHQYPNRSLCRTRQQWWRRTGCGPTATGRGFKVKVILFNISNKLSEDCGINKQRLIDLKYFNDFTEVTTTFDPPELTADILVIDGLFGSGLTRPLAGGFASLVKYINQSPSAW